MIRVKFINVIFVVFFLTTMLAKNAYVKNLKSPPKGASEAMKIAQGFSKEHTKGLKFVNTRKFAWEPLIYNLESDDADFEIDPQGSQFQFYLKDNAIQSLPKKGKLSKEEGKAMALNLAKVHYKDFSKKNMVFKELKMGQTVAYNGKTGQKTVIPPSEYHFMWIEHVKIGKYSVAIGNLVSVTVDAERHVITGYGYKREDPDFNLESFKPITIDENEAKSIAINYLKGKVKSRVNKVQIEGPSIRRVEPDNPTSPIKILWDIYIEREDQGIITGAFLYIDAKSGNIVYFSGMGL